MSSEALSKDWSGPLIGWFGAVEAWFGWTGCVPGPAGVPCPGWEGAGAGAACSSELGRVALSAATDCVPSGGRWVLFGRSSSLLSRCLGVAALSCRRPWGACLGTPLRRFCRRWGRGGFSDRSWALAKNADNGVFG